MLLCSNALGIGLHRAASHACTQVVGFLKRLGVLRQQLHTAHSNGAGSDAEVRTQGWQLAKYRSKGM